MEIWLYLEHPHNVIKYQFIGFPVGQDGLTAGIDNAKAAVHDHLYTTHNCKHRAAPDTSQKGMNLFHSEANTAINSVMWSNRKLTAIASNGACTYSIQVNKIYQWELTDTLHNQIKHTILNPKILLLCLDIKPAVDNSLIEAAKDRSNKMMNRIQTFS